MATDTAPLPLKTAPRRLWQLPTFVLGLVAIWAAATYVTPPPSAAAKQASKLDDLAAALDRQPIIMGDVEPLVRVLADSPSQTPRSHFVLGNAYVVMASVKPTESPDLWKLAAQHFEACEPGSLKPDEQAKLNFRLAKARASVASGDPALLIPALTNAPANEDRSECPRLIAECALRLPKPDLVRARDELTNYLGSAQNSPPAVADRYKLKLAELNRTLGDAERGRRWLKDISPNAPTDVLATAKITLAQQATAEKNWPEAVSLYEGVLALPNLPIAQKSAVRYALGDVFLKTGRVADAMPMFEQASREPGLLGGQASLRLAEIRAVEPTGKGKRADAIDWLERAAASIPMDSITDTERKSAQNIMQACLTEGDFGSATRAAQAYGKMTTANASLLFLGNIDAAWGEALANAGDPQAAAKKRSAAASAYVDAAAVVDREDSAWAMRRAVTLFRQAGEKDQALKLLEKLLAEKDAPDLAALHLQRAELLPPGDFANVKASLEQAMSVPGPQSLAAKLKLAMIYVQRGQELQASADTPQLKTEAQQTGEFGRSLLRQVAESATVPAELRPTHEQALFELGRLGLRDAKFADAEARFKKQITLYPGGTYAGYGRLWLVCSLLQQARSTDSKKLLEEALGYLAPLTQSSDAYLQTYGEIWTANTHLELGNVTEALTRSQAMVAKYKGKPEELVAGKLLFYAYLKLPTPEPAEASRALDRMEAAFAALPKSAYPSDPEYSHERWKTQLPMLREELRKFSQ